MERQNQGRCNRDGVGSGDMDGYCTGQTQLERQYMSRPESTFRIFGKPSYISPSCEDTSKASRSNSRSLKHRSSLSLREAHSCSSVSLCLLSLSRADSTAATDPVESMSVFTPTLLKSERTTS
jgi:hypothetical protein